MHVFYLYLTKFKSNRHITFCKFLTISSLLPFMLAYSDYSHRFCMFAINASYYRLYNRKRVIETASYHKK